MIKIKDLQIGNVVQFTRIWGTRNDSGKYRYEDVIFEGTISSFASNGVDCVIEDKNGINHSVGEWCIDKIIS